MEMHTPLPPFAALRRPSPPSLSPPVLRSGNRRNRGRVRRVDGLAQLLRKEAMSRCARMDPVTTECQPEWVVREAWRVESGEKRDLSRNPAQRVERGIGVDVCPTARRRLRGDVRVVRRNSRREL